jgi:hypothetical protein
VRAAAGGDLPLAGPGGRRERPQCEVHVERGGNAQNRVKAGLPLEADCRNVQFVLTGRKLEESVETERPSARGEMGVGRGVTEVTCAFSMASPVVELVIRPEMRPCVV